MTDSAQKLTFGHWLTAVRPWSFPASASPVVVTLGYLFASRDAVIWPYGLWALLAIIVFHAAGNVWSDYFDYRRGVDSADTFGAKSLTSGLFLPRQMFCLALGLLVVALALGLGLLLVTGLPLLWFGLAGAACTVLYPFLKYRALGDVVILLAYAFIPTLGTTYVATLSVDWSVLFLALPIGLITDAILHCNNTRDVATDRRASISTLAMRLGPRASIGMYCFEVLFPFVWLTACVALGKLPVWCLLSWLAVIPAAACARTALAYFKQGPQAIAHLDEATARLQLLFCLVLTVSFFLAGVLS